MPEFSFGDIAVYAYDMIGWLLGTFGLDPKLVVIIQKFAAAFLLANFALLTPIFTIWLERKIAARFQDRLGPNRVGPYGLFQSFADILKLLTKEIITPSGADKVVYFIGPILSVAPVLGIWVVIPFASTMIGSNLNVGVLYSVAIGGIGTLAIMMGGWASNNKYALLGAFRAASQLVSYEVPLILALLIPTLLTGSMGMQDIVLAQGTWFVVYAPIAAAIFLLSSLAEIGRAPFDILEAESEIVAGYHVEYSGFLFAIWQLGEFLHAFTISALTSVLFLGGWRGPLVDQFPILGMVYLLAKTYFVYFLTMWIRATVPRIRIDQMNNLNWKFLVPLALAALVLVALMDKLLPPTLVGSARAWAHFASNAALMVVVFGMLRAESRRLQSTPVAPRTPAAAVH